VNSRRCSMLKPALLDFAHQASIEYTASMSDFSPETTMNWPVGSMLNPRGYFSVGVLSK
jgi:hypothetical protein